MKKGKLFPEIENNLAADHNMTLAQGGREAAKATLTLMRDVAQFLPPRDIIDIYEQSFVDGTAHTTALWTGTGTQTGQVMALGVRTLAMLWDAGVGRRRREHECRPGDERSLADPVRRDGLPALGGRQRDRERDRAPHAAQQLSRLVEFRTLRSLADSTGMSAALPRPFCR